MFVKLNTNKKHYKSKLPKQNWGKQSKTAR